MEAYLMFFKLGVTVTVTHRIFVQRPAVRRTYLQQPQSWSAKKNNVYNNNNAYNGSGTIPRAAFHSVCAASS